MVCSNALWWWAHVKYCYACCCCCCDTEYLLKNFVLFSLFSFRCFVSVNCISYHQLKNDRSHFIRILPWIFVRCHSHWAALAVLRSIDLVVVVCLGVHCTVVAGCWLRYIALPMIIIYECESNEHLIPCDPHNYRRNDLPLWIISLHLLLQFFFFYLFNVV